jgi:Tfp pilus assembly protein PilE
METFFTLIIGGILGLGVYTLYNHLQNKKKVTAQSVILLDKIKKVCKFITVEGDFAEIYHYEDVKERFLKLVSSKKKALVVINAKAYVGYDFNKIELTSNHKKKTVTISHFPQPEILSIETNINYYDKKDGYFNRFEATDLTNLSEEAKQHIRDKVPESGLYNVAKKEALESLLLVENIVETIGWTLDYSALKISAKQEKLLK